MKLRRMLYIALLPSAALYQWMGWPHMGTVLPLGMATIVVLCWVSVMLEGF